VQLRRPAVNAELPATGTGVHYERIPEGEQPVEWYVPVEDEGATVPAIDYPLTPHPSLPLASAAPPQGSLTPPPHTHTHMWVCMSMPRRRHIENALGL
jgi:hypothetical protein